jgi:tRNA U34 5-carboxymethylaminomethyl modifying GTPase MnmE/TrmE
MEKEATNWEYRFANLEQKMLEHLSACSVKEITEMKGDIKRTMEIAVEIKSNQEKNYVTKDRHEAEINEVRREVEKVEESVAKNTKFINTINLAIILAVVGAVLTLVLKK